VQRAYKKLPSGKITTYEATRHTINVPAEMGPLLDDRIGDFGVFPPTSWRSVSDLLYLPKRPIAKAFANASRQRRRAIEPRRPAQAGLEEHVNLKVHFEP
jgi:hypothetical protein